MLNELKKKIHDELIFGTALEAASRVVGSNNDEIKDIFLDDPDALLIGAENDPVIEKLINDLPDAVDEDNEVTDSDIEELTENYIPESITQE